MKPWEGWLRFAALLYIAHWALICDAGVKKPALPGSHKYWVRLTSLDSDAGPLVPRFKPDGKDYELRVQDPYCGQVTFQLGLNFIKYNLMFTPVITVNGETLEYSPLKPIRYTVILNKSIGPYDEKFSFRVADPANRDRMFGWSTHNTHTYTVRILQPPQFGEVVEAEAIVVKNSSGHEIESYPKFNRSNLSTAYHYTLGETETQVWFKMTCGSFATKMMYDGDLVGMNDDKHIDLSETLEWRSLVECIYDDKSWTDNEVRRTYVLNFRRVAKMGGDHVKIMMMPHHGYCTTRDDYEISVRIGHIDLAGAPKADPINYLVCLSMVAEPELIAEHDDPRSRTILVNLATNKSKELPNLVPQKVHLKKGQRHYKLELTSWNNEKDFPIHLVHADLCSNLKCPVGWIKKIDLGIHNLASDQMCLEEKCSLVADKKHCCRKQPVRTKYVFGEIQTANEDGTYTVHFDEGGWDSIEYDVVKDHIMAVDVKKNIGHEAHRENSYTVGRRVEARISELEAVDLKRSKIGMLGISTREKLAHYYSVGCRPEPEECPLHNREFSWSKNPQHLAIPARLDPNNKSVKACYYDESCDSDSSESGCNANNLNTRCRWCGFDDYPECPKTYMCDWGNPTSWSKKKVAFCCDVYDYGCPWWCRWGKWIPDEAHAWGPWWTKEKQDWCCEHKDIGCYTGTWRGGGKGVINRYDVWHSSANSTVENIFQRVPDAPTRSVTSYVAVSLMACVVAAFVLNRSRRRHKKYTSRALIPEFSVEQDMSEHTLSSERTLYLCDCSISS